MKLHNLQILRGISALLVCAFHFRGDLNFDANNWGDLFFSNGSIGVPIFFVISGYIMVYSTRNVLISETRKNIISFLKKRLIRIVPLYYLLTAAWIILGGSLFYYLQKPNSDRLLYSLFFLPQNNNFPVLFLGWSLNYEMFFYTVFAFSFVFKKNRYRFLVLFFTLMMILGKIFPPENAFLKLVTDLLNIYFVIGILLGLFLHKIRCNRTALLLYSLVSIVLFGLYFFKIFAVSSWFLTTVLVSLFVSAFLVFDLFLQVKANAFLKWLGDISYSIYLSHPFVEIVFRRVHTENPLFFILLFIIKLVVVILVSKLLFETVEKRFSNYLKRKILADYR